MSPTESNASDAAAAPAGARVLKGKYEVLESLAETDRCLLFRGRLLPGGGDLAIKFLKERYSQDPAFVERYAGELRTTANLPGHPNLMRYEELDTIARRFVAVMEFFPHPSAESLLRRKEPLALPVVLVLIRQLASVLDLGFREGLLSRTVRLEDVLVSEQGRRCKLLRFASPRSPATARARKPAGPESDLLFLGDALHQLLTGGAPTGGRQESPETTSEAMIEAMKTRYRDLSSAEIAAVARFYVALASRDLARRLESFQAFTTALDELEAASPTVQEERRKAEQERLREETQARFSSASDTVALLTGQPPAPDEGDRAVMAELARPLEPGAPPSPPPPESEGVFSGFNIAIGSVALLLAGFVYWLFYR